MLGGDMKLSMRLMLHGTRDVEAKLSRAGDAMNRFTSHSIKRMRALNKELNGFGAVSKMAAAWGGMNIFRDTFNTQLQFERDFIEMKQTSELSTAQAIQARKFIMDSAREVLQTPTEMLEGIRAFTSAGQSYQQAVASVKESAVAASAFFVNAGTIADMDVDLMQKDGLRPDQLNTAHNMMLYHARAGRFEATPMATEAPKYLNSASFSGITGLQGLNLTGALTQAMMRYAPKTQPGEVSTYFQHGLGHITQPHYVKSLGKIGIDMHRYMPGGKFYGEGGVQGFVDLVRAMKQKGLEDPFKLGKAGFREEYTQKFWLAAMKNIDLIQSEMQQAQQASKQDLVGKAFAEIKEANFGKIKAAQIEAEKLQLGDVATKGTTMTADATRWAGDHPVAAAGAGFAGMIGLRWLWNKGVPRLFDNLEEGKGIAGSGTRGAGALLRRVPMLTALLGAVQAWDIHTDAKKTDAQKRQAYGGVVGGMAGGATGAAYGGMVGATVGSVVPIIGTAAGAVIGSLLGGVLGGVGGDAGGKSLMGAINQLIEQSKKPVPVQLTSTLVVDGHQLAQVVNQNNTQTARRN